MALVKYGGGIIQMSGSLAGTTHARNRFGNYMRARTKPVNPKSPRQVAARIIVMFLAEQWRESPMTDSIRAAWQTYAAAINWTNKLGDTVKLTGFNHFMRSNAAILAAGGTLVTAAPTDLGLPAGDPTIDVSNSYASNNVFDFVFDDTQEWCDEDNAFMVLELGQPQNSTRNYFGGPWRIGWSIPGSTVTPPTSPLNQIPQTAFTFVVGQKVWLRASIIRADARVSTKFEAEPFIVGA